MHSPGRQMSARSIPQDPHGVALASYFENRQAYVDWYSVQLNPLTEPPIEVAAAKVSMDKAATLLANEQAMTDRGMACQLRFLHSQLDMSMGSEEQDIYRLVANVIASLEAKKPEDVMFEITGND